jgi:hypothetical protein
MMRATRRWPRCKKLYAEIMTSAKLKAFTIMEVTIVMLVSAIVIAITYTAFSIVNRSLRAFNRQHQDMAIVLQLDRVLRIDIDRAELMLRDTDGVILKNSSRTIKYQFVSDYVLRKELSIDTFKVKIDSISTTFENKQVNVTEERQDESRVDELDVNIHLQNENIPYYYHKQYSSENLINRNPDAVH